MFFVLSYSLLAQPVDNLQVADQAWKNRHSAENACNLVLLYKKAVESSNNNDNLYDSLWKYSRACIFYAQYFLKNNKTEAEKYYTAAKDICIKATQIKSDGIEGIFYLGMSYSGFQTLSTAKEAKKRFEEVLNLNPEFSDAAAYRALGRMYFKLPGWPVSFGSNSTSIQYLKKAVELGPNNRANYLFLAEVLYDEDEAADAEKFVEQALLMPFNSEYKTEEEDCIAALKALQEKIKKD